MATKRMYRRISVKKVSLEGLKDTAISKGGAGTCFGLDIGKSEIVAVIRWSDGSFECPISVKNPSEIADLIAVFVMLRQICGSLTIGLESTGTYGEPIRMAMTAASLEVHRISGKASSDYKEIFDGVPSQHDGKDAAIIAELTRFGKGTPWPFQPLSEDDQRIKHQVRRMDVFHEHATEWTGRLEAVLAEHWPELSGLLSLNSVTLVKIMIEYGSPARLAADPAAREKLARWGRSALKPQKIEQIIESSRTTKGTPIDGSERAWLQEIASELQAAILKVDACRKELELIANSHNSMREYVSSVGAVTLCVIWACVGDPRNYDSSGAFLKALGLNLKELSSGQRQGQLAITKRGPSLARKYLFFWAMRAVQDGALKGWYEDFQKVGRGSSGNSEHRKMKGLIALMRKLSRSLWYAHKQHEEFDYAKVFPGRPLQKRQRRRRREQVSTK